MRKVGPRWWIAVVLFAGTVAALTYAPGADSASPIALRLGYTQDEASSSAVWNRPVEPLTVARFQVHEQSDTRVGRALARALREALLEQPGVADVALVRAGAEAPEDDPDVHLAVEARVELERVYPGFLELACEVRVTAHGRPPPGAPGDAPAAGPVLLEASVRHAETTYGLVSPSRRHDGPVLALLDVLDLPSRLSQWRAGPTTPR